MFAVVFCLSFGSLLHMKLFKNQYIWSNCDLWCRVLMFQESKKTKHPQLLYEAKLYSILQGESKLYDMKEATQ